MADVTVEHLDAKEAALLAQRAEQAQLHERAIAAANTAALNVTRIDAQLALVKELRG